MQKISIWCLFFFSFFEPGLSLKLQLNNWVDSPADESTFLGLPTVHWGYRCALPYLHFAGSWESKFRSSCLCLNFTNLTIPEAPRKEILSAKGWPEGLSGLTMPRQERSKFALPVHFWLWEGPQSNPLGLKKKKNVFHLFLAGSAVVTFSPQSSDTIEP